jgi:salicylate hydroxylase
LQLKSLKITIIGAGVAGLTLALALVRRGALVRVLEQADHIGEIGAGLQVSPNGGAVLRALGVQIEAVRAEAVILRNGADCRPVLRMDLARRHPEREFCFVHRADLIGALKGAAEASGVQISAQCRVLSVDLSGVRPAFQLESGAETADLLIGADGLHSLVRAALNGPQEAFFTGQVAWRGVIDCEAGAPEVAEVFMGPGRHLVSYPIRGGRFRNLVAVEERARWTEASWTLREDPQAMRRAFEAFDPKVRGWLDQLDEAWLWGLFRHEVAPSWARALAGGGAAILGDAAHPTLPFVAQGASLALEDAFVLARELERGADMARALTRYQDLRHGRCTRAVAAANFTARAYHLREPLRAFAHLALRIGGRLAPGFALSRYDWLYGHDVTAED